ncbi:hypothetical protein CDCA_CDCA01G0338 [Cyanidium caldarium]|uniref:Pentatricopeptide repeat-containing protein n=1 Tax=Cyanidium caldarium TaxID=2771 RepID=A0AAV9IPZ0_CYACA|nr:hypothetical protein CDCA_CDCA01G0338 [Cyanidium caldarium]
MGGETGPVRPRSGPAAETQSVVSGAGALGEDAMRRRRWVTGWQHVALMFTPPERHLCAYASLGGPVRASIRVRRVQCPGEGRSGGGTCTAASLYWSAGWTRTWHGEDGWRWPRRCRRQCASCRMRAGDAADKATPPIPPRPIRRQRREEVADIVRSVASDPSASSLPPPSGDVAVREHTLFPLAPNDAVGYRLAVQVCCLMSEVGAAAEAATALRQLLRFCAHQHHWRQMLPTYCDQLAVVRRFLQQVRHDRGRQRVSQLLPLIRQLLASADPLMELCEQTALRLSEQVHGNADMAALLAFLNEAWDFFAAPPSTPPSASPTVIAVPFPSPSRASGANARSFLPTGCALQIITSLSRRDASLACHFLEWYPRADGQLCLRVANACARAADQGGDPLPLLERVRQVMRVRDIPMSAYLLATFVNGIARTACARDARRRPADDAGRGRGCTRTAQRSAAFAVRLVDALLLEFGLAPGTAAATTKVTEDAPAAGQSSATRLQADATLHNAVVDAYVRCNEWSRARQYVQYHTRRSAREGGAMPRRVKGNDVDDDDFPTIDTYNILLKGMAVQTCASPTPQAVASLQRFFARQIPVPKDAITYNIMLKACAELDDYRTAFAILDEAVARFPQPVAATAGRKERTAGNLGHGVVSVLSGLGRRNQVDAALQWLRAHGQQLLGEASQLIAFSALVAACFQHHQVQHAWKLFREALSNGQRHGPGLHDRRGESAPAGSSEVRALVDCADPELLDALTGLYNAMITGLCRHQLVDEALELREEMVREGVPRTATTYHALMNGLVHSKPSAPRTPWKAASGATTDGGRRRWTRVEDAEHLAKQHMQREMPPTAVSYSILLHGYGMERDVAQVRRVFREMLQLRLRPQLVTLNTLLRALVRCGKVALAERVFDEIFERRPEARPPGTPASPAPKSSPSPCAWLAVRGHRSNALPAAILRAVSGLEPDAHSYSILVSALMRSGRQDAALARFVEMRARRVRPDRFFYRMMIGIAVEQRRLDIGLQVLQAAEADVPEALLQEWRARLDVWETQARDAPARGDGQRSAAEEIFRRHRWNPIDSRARWFF